ncbi:hypothetical protein RvY_07009 [Ramazzottius varieornatus]|uniref:Uncharacterized protein n=1 Tax=Ramazzottius varieornatus TaxID=947166 RepID=A0A1D1V972_RAMVA|nr:hypothetical protein RvY_07009 [Ramazzottius varieornatus]
MAQNCVQNMIVVKRKNKSPSNRRKINKIMDVGGFMALHPATKEIKPRRTRNFSTGQSWFLTSELLVNTQDELMYGEDDSMKRKTCNVQL